MNEQSYSLVLISVASLAMVYPKRGFAAITPSLIASCLPSCWVLGTKSFHKSSAVSCVLFLKVSYFTDLFLPLYLEFMEDSSTVVASLDDSSLVLSLAHDLPVLDPMAPLSPKPLIGLNLCCSTWVSILPPYLTDYHCSFAFATLYEPHTYCEAHTDPLW